MLIIDRQAFRDAATYFDLAAAGGFVELSRSSRTLLACTRGGRPRKVIRFSHFGSGNLTVTHQVNVISRVQGAGFTNVQKFARGVTGYEFYIDHLGLTASVYDYIAGSARQPVPTPEWPIVTTVLNQLTETMGSVTAEGLPVGDIRIRFEADLQVAQRLLRKWPLPYTSALPIFRLLLAEIEPLAGCHIIHGDLNAGNLIRRKSRVAVIDFESAAIGCVLAELAPIMTSIPFDGSTLNWLRIDSLLRQFSRKILEHATPDQFSRILPLTAIAFFGRSNATVGAPKQLEIRDFLRALELVRYEKRIASVLHEASRVL